MLSQLFIGLTVTYFIFKLLNNHNSTIINKMSSFDSVKMQSVLDECEQSHIYQNTGCLNDESHPVSQQVMSLYAFHVVLTLDILFFSCFSFS
jgi:CTP synthase (UTP-ammonia lyase)